jgi:hypothetical protein
VTILGGYKQNIMTAYSIYFDNANPAKIKALLDFVQSLDYVQKIEPIPQQEPVVEVLAEPVQGYLTKSEICRLYPDEWVLLIEHATEGIEVLGGKVLLHAKDKRALAVKSQQKPLPDGPKRFFYTGAPTRIRKVGLFQKISV